VSSYIIRRFLTIIPMLIAISALLFLLMNMAPGGPEQVMIGDMERYSPRMVEHIREQFALDQPIHIRFAMWLWNAVRGDFGVSTTQAGGVKVFDMIRARLPATLQLNGTALLLSVLVGVPLGIVTAVYRYSLLDKFATVFAFLGICFPTFWLGVMLMLLFGIVLGWLPVSGIAPPGMRGAFWPSVHHAILPSFTLAFVGMGRYTRYTRSSILEVLRHDYIRTARAKGLSERVVLFRHALRNSLISVVTVIGLSLPALVGGSIMVEMVFAWPGMGRLAVMSIQRRDYAVVMGVQLVIATAVLVANLLVDVVYAWIDPRITYS